MQGRTRIPLRVALATAVASLVLAAPAAASNFLVNSTADTTSPAEQTACASGGSGCTLRAAIAQANTSSDVDAITFSVSGTIAATGGYTISQPLTITGNNPIAIDGPGIASAGAVPGFAITGTPVTLSGLEVRDFSGAGVSVTADGATIGAGNVIHHNGGDGVHVATADNATVDSNTIYSNLGNGIEVASGAGNTLTRNQVFGNASPGILIASGANGDQAAPALPTPSAPERLSIGLNGPADTYDIELFSSSSCAGGDPAEFWFDTVQLTITGVSAGMEIPVPPGNYTATATDSDGNTSQISNCRTVAAAPPPEPAPHTPPLDLAQALFGDPIITGAEYVTTPPGIPGAGPVAVVFPGPLNGFPTSGGTFTALSNGDAASVGNGGGSARGEPVRGDTDYDVTVLKVDINVPAGNCLQMDLRFLSNEYPTYVGGQYNDAFIAELDSSTWTTAGSAINAPGNFAFDDAGNVLSVNAAGAATVSAASANGTSYGGGTKLLRASTPVTPGPHSVYLSIFDQGDSILDSAAYIDNLAARDMPADQCKPGVVDASAPPVQEVPQDQGPPALPPPTRGETANVTPKSGSVFVKLPPGASKQRRYAWAQAAGGGGAPKGFIPLSQARQIPVGSTLDTRRGTVGLTTAAAGTQTQSADFNRGLFRWGQGSKNALTTLSMTQNLGCSAKPPSGGAKKVVAARRRSRSLFGSGRGRFRTRGRNSSATVRGTQWLVKDTCQSTITTVKQGTVLVRDFTKGKTIKVKKGKRYTARAPKRRNKR